MIKCEYKYDPIFFQTSIFDVFFLINRIPLNLITNQAKHIKNSLILNILILYSTYYEDFNWDPWYYVFFICKSIL